MQSFLAYAWLVFSALWIRGGVAFFKELMTANGSGTGGLLLVAPLAAIAIVAGVAGVFIGFFLGAGSKTARRFAMVFSVIGLVLAVIAVPVALFAMIGIMVIVESGYVLSAIALVITPGLFVLTLAGLLAEPAPAAMDRRRFFAVGVLIVATAFLPNWKWGPPVDDRPPEVIQAELEKYVEAVKTNDAKLLTDSRVWDLFLDCPKPDGSVGGGDPLQCAIDYRNATSVILLLKRKPIGRPLELYRDQALATGDEVILQILADAGADFKDDHAVQNAFYSKSPTSLRFVLAHGVTPQQALCVLNAMYGLDEAVATDHRTKLISAGADPKACR